MSTHSLPSRSSLFTSENGSSASIYTAKPLADEVTLESASICGLSSGGFERTSGPLALRLHDQIDGVSRPTIYHKHRISGAALIQSEECSSTTKVALKFEGALTIEIDGGVSQTISVLEETHVVWQAHESSTSPPSSLPFAIELTPEFADKGGHRRPLPPTCNFSFRSPASLRARASYTMTLTVNRRKKHGVLPKSKSQVHSPCLIYVGTDWKLPGGGTEEGSVVSGGWTSETEHVTVSLFAPSITNIDSRAALRRVPSCSIPFDYVRRSKPHLPMRVEPASDAALWFHQTSQITFKTPTTQPLLAKLSIPAARCTGLGTP